MPKITQFPLIFRTFSRQCREAREGREKEGNGIRYYKLISNTYLLQLCGEYIMNPGEGNARRGTELRKTVPGLKLKLKERQKKPKER